MKKHAAIYVRVSTEEQAKSGYSLADQISSCREHLIKLGYNDIEEYVDDGYSGEFLDRPALTKLRDNISYGAVSVIVIYDPDRLARKLSIQLLVADEFEKAKVPFYFITGNYDASPEGRLFFSMRGAIAEFEKAKIIERSSRGKRKKASQGLIMQDFGLFGYGYNKENCSYFIKEDEAKIIRLIFNLLINKQLSVEGVQKELKKLVISSPTGNPLWSTSTLHRVLTNETYTGTFYSMKSRYQRTGIKTKTKTPRKESEWIPIKVPVIIDELTFKRAKQQLSSNITSTKARMTHEYLLSGIIFCGVCGRRMLAHHCRFRDGHYKAYYDCSAHRYANIRNSDIKCESRCLPAEAIDEDIWNKLVECLLDTDKIKKYLPKKKKETDYSEELKRLTQLEDDLLKRRETITKWFRKQMISEQEAEEELKQIRSQIYDIEKRKNILHPVQKSSCEYSIEDVANKFRPMAESGVLSFDQKRRLVHSILTKITVVRVDHHTGKGARSKPPKFKITWETI